MTYLGLDISLTKTGVVGLSANGKIVLQKLVTSKPMPERFKRFDDILCSIDDCLSNVKLVTIEGYSYGSQGNSLLNICELSGIIKHHLWLRDINFIEVPPATLKKYATGRGNVGKLEMIQAAHDQYGYKFESDDLCDAYWLAKYGIDKTVDK